MSVGRVAIIRDRAVITKSPVQGGTSTSLHPQHRHPPDLVPLRQPDRLFSLDDNHRAATAHVKPPRCPPQTHTMTASVQPRTSYLAEQAQAQPLPLQMG